MTMGMTMTQKILAAHAGLDSVSAGQLISAKLDIVLGNDITTPVAIKEFKKAGFDKIFDKMNDADKRKLIESMILEVQLHPKETWEEGKNPIKEIKYAFPVSDEVMDALRENVASVETCVLLSKLKSTKHIDVEVKLS